MRMGQHMKLAPRMIQSMEILQMPLLQLEERIAQELESNVTLEADAESDAPESASTDDAFDADLDGPPSSDTDDQDLDDADTLEAGEHSALDGDAPPMEVGESSGKDDFERLESFEADNPDAGENEFDERSAPTEYEMPDRRELGRLDSEPDAKSQAMANTPSRSASLVEQLQDQWHLADVDDALRALGEHIISFIEDDGYLRTPLETIIDRLPGASSEKPTLPDMQNALRAVQILLEPPGVAAHDTRECLLLQVDGILEQPGRTPLLREQWSIVRRLIADHLDDLAQNRLPRIVEKTGLTMPEVKDAIEKMRHLSLAPARQLVSEAPGVIIPDAIIEYDADQDRYIAYLNDSRLPNLQINKEYAALAKSKDSPKETREFLKKNLSNASWLIDAVEQRRRTLLRVIRVVVDAQREYFDYGPQSLRPLPMTQVAEQLGIHVATVSRAVSDKYLFTPRGVVPLRGFFSGGTQTHSGEEVSWDAVKAALKEIIDAEDKANPLSDDALAERLTEKGIDIARRTVAKYRDQLSIPPARLRKTF